MAERSDYITKTVCAFLSVRFKYKHGTGQGNSCEKDKQKSKKSNKPGVDILQTLQESIELCLKSLGECTLKGLECKTTNAE